MESEIKFCPTVSIVSSMGMCYIGVMPCRTVHSKISCSGPKALENTRPPMGLPSGSSYRRAWDEVRKVDHNHNNNDKRTALCRKIEQWGEQTISIRAVRVQLV